MDKTPRRKLVRHPRSMSVLAVFAVLAALAAAAVALAQHEKHWAYEDGSATVGPAHWSSIPGNEPCGAGKRQSPIAIVAAGAPASSGGELHDTFGYKPSKISLVNNGHTVQAGYDPGSSVSEGGVSYSLAQFHFHAPSEHTLDGRSYPLEIHLVHLDPAGKPALVVGVLVKEGRANPALAAVFANLPKREGEKVEPVGATVDASALFPADRSHFAYDGSLTTPSCSEGIRWRVMRQPIEMSTSQIQAYRSLPHLGHTNRPIQLANGRVVTLVREP
jgi:carbonic anhydrase